MIEGAVLVGYGNSYVWMNWAPPLCARRYFDRVSSRIRAQSLNKFGVGGYLMGDASRFAQRFRGRHQHRVKGGTYFPLITNRGLLIVDCIRNDAGWDGLNTVQSRAGFVNGLDSLLRLLRS